MAKWDSLEATMREGLVGDCRGGGGWAVGAWLEMAAWVASAYEHDFFNIVRRFCRDGHKLLLQDFGP